MAETKKPARKFGSIAAVNGINLSIAEGGIFCLLGPKDAGKTKAIPIFSMNPPRNENELIPPLRC